MDGALPRINPTYIHWLAQQSMLGKADSLIAEVSGSARLWQNSGSADRWQFFLQSCPNWLDINPHLESTLRPVFRTFTKTELQQKLLASGVQGVFISPTGEPAEIWASREQPVDQTGVDIVSFNFALAAGDADSLQRLVTSLNQNNIQLGGSLPPAATGLGPDFMLEMRAATGFTGLYAAVEVPANQWQILPKVSHEWPGVPLSPQATTALQTAGLLPKAILREHLNLGFPGGWAATGKVRCADGNERRWVYYFVHQVTRPLLLWQDPSNHARKLYAAATIKLTGLEQQALAGINLTGWFGLDSSQTESTQAAAINENMLEPGLSALGTISQDIRRYGGWALETDQLPPRYTKYLLGKTDFVRDNYIDSALAYALLTQDTEPLKAMVRILVNDKIPQQRLAHGVYSWEPINWQTLLDLPSGNTLLANAQGKTPQDDFFTRQTLLLGLPGLCFVKPNAIGFDLARRPPKINLPKSSPNTQINVQSPTNTMAIPLLLQARVKYHVAEGELLLPLASPNGTIVLLNRLPDKKYWLTCANFSNNTQHINTNLSNNFGVTSGQELGNTDNSPHANIGHNINISLKPHQVRIFLLKR